MLQITVKSDEFDTQVLYELHRDKSTDFYYWFNKTHNHILPELFSNPTIAKRWMETICDEIGAAYSETGGNVKL